MSQAMLDTLLDSHCNFVAGGVGHTEIKDRTVKIYLNILTRCTMPDIPIVVPRLSFCLPDRTLNAFWKELHSTDDI